MAYIAGFGVCVPENLNCTTLKQNLINSNSPLKEHSFGDQAIFASKFSSQELQNIKQNYTDIDLQGSNDEVLYAFAVIDEALQQANLTINDLAEQKVHLVFATCQTDLTKSHYITQNILSGTEDKITQQDILASYYCHLPKVLAKHYQINLNILTFCSACASSNNAVGFAADLIDNNQADLVLVVSLDSYSDSTTAGFYALQAQIKQRTMPFGQTIGLNIGEGAACLVLSKNKGKYEWQIVGYALSGDAYHITTPDPNGVGAISAMQKALENAQIKTNEIELIKSHGTGTNGNDIAESKAIYHLFQNNTPTVSLKAFFGRTLGGSGLIEAIATLLLSEDGLLPANYCFTQKRANLADINLLPNKTTQKPLSTFLVNAFAFGGNNSATVWTKKLLNTKVIPNKKAIFINEVGMSTLFSSSNQELFEQIGKKQDDRLLKLPNHLKQFFRCSKQAKLTLLSVENNFKLNELQEATGVIGGMASCSFDFDDLYQRSVIKDKTAASALLFPETSLNTTAGILSQCYGLKGYNTTLIGSISAFLYAVNLLDNRRVSELIVATADTTSNDFIKSRTVTGLWDEYNFADIAVSFKISQQKTPSSLHIEVFDNLNDINLNDIKYLFSNNNAKIDNLTTICINDFIGNGFSTSFAINIWFVYQCFVNQYIPVINQKLNQNESVLIESCDLTGNQVYVKASYV